MPNRIIKESICTSENIESLTPFQETVFVRLIVNCDDFGRYDARPKLLSSRLFPLRDVPIQDMEEAIQALQNADLITVYYVDGHPYLFMNKWLNHQQKRSDKSKYPDPVAEPLPADANSCKQMISDDSECARNRERERNTINDKRYSQSAPLVADDEAHKIQSEQNRVLDAAEDAGFKMSNNVRAALIGLYADFGLDKMLEGFTSCSEHSAPNLAYLRAVLKGSPKRENINPNSAHNFHERDYSGVQDELMVELEKEMDEFLKTGKTRMDKVREENKNA